MKLHFNQIPISPSLLYFPCTRICSYKALGYSDEVRHVVHSNFVIILSVNKTQKSPALFSCADVQVLRVPRTSPEDTLHDECKNISIYLVHYVTGFFVVFRSKPVNICSIASFSCLRTRNIFVTCGNKIDIKTVICLHQLTRLFPEKRVPTNDKGLMGLDLNISLFSVLGRWKKPGKDSSTIKVFQKSERAFLSERKIFEVPENMGSIKSA